MKPLLTLIVAVVAIAYPLLVYFGINHVSPAIFALVLVVLAVTKFVVGRNHHQTSAGAGEWGLLLVAVGYSLALVITNNAFLLKLYPVLISLCVALLFAMSLRAPESLIERMARMAGETISPRAKNYTRRLTGIWAILLVANAMVALYLALFADLKSWALYSGLLSYLFFGLFFAVEYAYRRYYINKYRDHT